MNCFGEVCLRVMLTCYILIGGFVAARGLSSMTKVETDESFEYEAVIADENFQCPSNSENVMFPHPVYCEKYYKCRNGVAELSECSRANALLFNDVKAHCHYDYETHCKDRIRPNDTNPTREPPPPETTTIPTTTTIKPITTTQIPFNCTENGAFPHPQFCQWYYDCWENLATLLSCPNGTLFDIEYSGCKDSDSTDCGDRERPGLFDCPVGEEEGAHYPDPDDCSAFFQCKDGISYHHRCPEDLVFNPKLDVCDFPHNVDCPTGNKASSPPSSSTLSSFPFPS